MTIEEFDKTGFLGSDRVEYQDKTYALMSINFPERLVAFNVPWDEDLYWVRCENVKLLKTVADG